jgi:hypothetical protein
VSKEPESKLHEDDLIIPIYIDTNALLDVIAAVEGGFSIVEKYTSHTLNSRSADQSASTSVGTEFGVPNVLNLLKISLGGALNWKQNKENTDEHSVERYHTYGSLFQRLRSALKNQQVKTQQVPFQTFDGDPALWDHIKPFSFIEMQGLFSPNPLTDSISTILRLTNMMESFVQSATPSRSTKQQKPQVALLGLNSLPDLQQVKQMKVMIQGFLDNLEKQDMRTVVVSTTSSNTYQAVISLFTEYLRDKSMSELLYKEYKLFGKVVGRTPDSTSSVDLVQGTSLSGMNDKKLTELLKQMNQQNSDILLPPVKTKIAGPALQIIPIAIYV